MSRLIKLNDLDNVQIVIQEIKAGETLVIDGIEVYFNRDVCIGHKIAALLIEEGQKIIKYGVPVGSATTTIEMGKHVHLHNMKSDYIPTYTLSKEYKGELNNNNPL